MRTATGVRRQRRTPARARARLRWRGARHVGAPCFRRASVSSATLAARRQAPHPSWRAAAPDRSVASPRGAPADRRAVVAPACCKRWRAATCRTCKRWLDSGQARLRCLTAASPPSTPVFTAGLLYGARDGVPGFGWYDRALGRQVRMDLAEDVSALEPALAGGPPPAARRRAPATAPSGPAAPPTPSSTSCSSTTAPPRRARWCATPTTSWSRRRRARSSPAASPRASPSSSRSGCGTSSAGAGASAPRASSGAFSTCACSSR